MEIKDIKNWQYEELSDQEAEAVSGGKSSSELLSQITLMSTRGCNPGDGGGGGPHGLAE